MSLLCVSTIQRSRWTREDMMRVALNALRTESEQRDRIKRANYNRHDLNQRFIWEIVYLLLSTNKIFLYTSESNSFVFINTRIPYSYIFFPSSKRFYQSSLLIRAILFLVLAVIYNTFSKCLWKHFSFLDKLKQNYIYLIFASNLLK